MAGPIISFQKVSKKFKRHAAIVDVTLDIYPNEVFGILGVNGAGKTTLLRTLIGYYRVDGGQILFNKRDIHQNLEVIRRIFGFCTQDNCFYGELSLIQNLMYFGNLYQLDTKTMEQRAEHLLSMVGLTSKRDEKAHTLSGGMKRRLDLCCALMHDPQILILDEPAAGLDPLHRNQMWHLIKKIQLMGKTVIISSHLLTEIEHICNRIGILSHGKIRSIGTPDQLKAQFSHSYELHLECLPMCYNKIIGYLEKNVPITRWTVQENKAVIFTIYPERALHWILHYVEDENIRIIDVDINKPSLLEVFESLVGQNV